jgi:hypothetical protein
MFIQLNSSFERWKYCPRDGQLLEAHWAYCPTCGIQIGSLGSIFNGTPYPGWGNTSGGLTTQAPLYPVANQANTVAANEANTVAYYGKPTGGL